MEKCSKRLYFANQNDVHQRLGFRYPAQCQGNGQFIQHIRAGSLYNQLSSYCAIGSSETIVFFYRTNLEFYTTNIMQMPTQVDQKCKISGHFIALPLLLHLFISLYLQHSKAFPYSEVSKSVEISKSR